MRAPLLLISILFLTSPSFAVINGEAVRPDTFPSLVKIKIGTSESASYTCTGTFIASDSVLTAKHCLDGAVKVAFAMPGKVIKVRNFRTVRHETLDIALIQFGDIGVHSFMEIDFARSDDGNQVTFLGFGKSEFYHLINRLRIGHQKIARFSVGVSTTSTHSYDDEGRPVVILREAPAPIYTIGTVLSDSDQNEKPAAARPGDSGGPLLKNYVTEENAFNRIIGVVTQMDSFAKYGTIAVPSFSFEEFIRSHVSRYRLPTTSISSPPSLFRISSELFPSLQLNSNA